MLFLQHLLIEKITFVSALIFTYIRSYYNQTSRGDSSGRQSPHLQPGAQGDDISHADSGGIFAKLRGRVVQLGSYTSQNIACVDHLIQCCMDGGHGKRVALVYAVHGEIWSTPTPIHPQNQHGILVVDHCSMKNKVSKMAKLGRLVAEGYFLVFFLPSLEYVCSYLVYVASITLLLLYPFSRQRCRWS